MCRTRPSEAAPGLAARVTCRGSLPRLPQLVRTLFFTETIHSPPRLDQRRVRPDGDRLEGPRAIEPFLLNFHETDVLRHYREALLLESHRHCVVIRIGPEIA